MRHTSDSTEVERRAKNREGGNEVKIIDVSLMHCVMCALFPNRLNRGCFSKFVGGEERDLARTFSGGVHSLFSFSTRLHSLSPS